MDKRITKTQSAIKSEFLSLLKKKPLHKITVKELCEATNINKSTFYTHYTDIYHLMDSLRQEAVTTIVSSIPSDREYTLDNAEEFPREITIAFQKQRQLLTSLFTIEDLHTFGYHLEIGVKKAIFEKNPHLKSNAKINILLSYCIQGAFHAQMNNPNVSFDSLLETLDLIVKTLKPLYQKL